MTLREFFMKVKNGVVTDHQRFVEHGLLLFENKIQQIYPIAIRLRR